MNLRDKTDKETIAPENVFKGMELNNVSNDVPHGDEIDRIFKFCTLTTDERFVLVLRKFDYLQDKIDKLELENERLKNTIEEMKRKDFWKGR